MTSLHGILARTDHLEIVTLAEAETCEARVGELQLLAGAKRQKAKSLKRLRSRLQGLRDVLAETPAELFAALQLQDLLDEDRQDPTPPAMDDAAAGTQPGDIDPDPQNAADLAPSEACPVVGDRVPPVPELAQADGDDGLVPAYASGGSDLGTAAQEAPPLSVNDALDARVMSLIVRGAAGTGQALFQRSKLAEKAETSDLRLDKSLTRLAEAGRIVRRKSLPGHVAFDVLDRAEVAA